MAEKRICELQPGDIFTYAGARRLVIRIEEGNLKHRTYPIAGGHTASIGSRCKAKVEFHGNDSNEHNVERFTSP